MPFIAEIIKKNINIPCQVVFAKKQDDFYFKASKNADVIITMSWGKSMWSGKKKDLKVPRTEKLKLIHVPGAGYDGINFKKLPKGCKVCNVYEHEMPIAEFCIASMLNWEINLIEKVNKFKKLDWSDGTFFSGATHGELFNKTVGILGYGKIGKEIAKRLKPFSSRIVAFTRVKRTKEKFLDETFTSKSLSKKIKKLDYLILACPLNKNTANIINKSNLKNMKKTAVIINIARGGVINEEDLFNYLKEKKIGGAIIDTWFKYPGPEGKKGFMPSKFGFHKLSNVVMTPHISGWTKNMVNRRCKVMIKNIENLYNKKRLVNLIED